MGYADHMLTNDSLRIIEPIVTQASPEQSPDSPHGKGPKSL